MASSRFLAPTSARNSSRDQGCLRRLRAVRGLPPDHPAAGDCVKLRCRIKSALRRVQLRPIWSECSAMGTIRLSRHRPQGWPAARGEFDPRQLRLQCRGSQRFVSSREWRSRSRMSRSSAAIAPRIGCRTPIARRPDRGVPAPSPSLVGARPGARLPPRRINENLSATAITAETDLRLARISAGRRLCVCKRTTISCERRRGWPDLDRIAPRGRFRARELSDDAHATVRALTLLAASRDDRPVPCRRAPSARARP